MKISASICRICGKCKPIRKRNQDMIMCFNLRHKRMNGSSGKRDFDMHFSNSTYND
jgi:ribosomal protein L36